MTIKVNLFERGQRNILDAIFIRNTVIPAAQTAQRWNIVVFESYRVLELIIKGIICMYGKGPKKTHALGPNISNGCMSVRIDETEIMSVTDLSIAPPFIIHKKFKLKRLIELLGNVSNIGRKLLDDRENAFYSTAVYSEMAARRSVELIDTAVAVARKIVIMDYIRS